MRYFYDYKAVRILEENQVFDSQHTLRRVVDDLFPNQWINTQVERLPDNTFRFFIEADRSLRDTLLTRGFRCDDT
jgi:hypothetical protein